MKERPIIFNSEMVKAILDNHKTMTRRIIKPSSKANLSDGSQPEWVFTLAKCPYGQVGDRLWVKETWMAHKDYDHLKPSDIPRTSPLWYWADGNHYADKVEEGAGKVLPYLFMPHWASRILLEITEVKIERLQSITEEDAIAEGIKPPEHAFRMISGGDVEVNLSPKELFAELWDSLNAKRGYPWESNCWVWVISFRRIN